MKCGFRYGLAGIVWGTLLATIAVQAQTNDERFTLTRCVPADVFLYVGARDNPQRAFLDQYWAEVFDELKRSGIGDDLLDLIGSMLDADQKAQIARLKQAAGSLLASVDWSALVGGEFAFVERFHDVEILTGGGINFGPPDMAWLFRHQAAKAPDNYAGLVAIFDAMLNEIDRLRGGQISLVMEENPVGSARTARLMASAGPKNPMLTLTLTPDGSEKLGAAAEKLIGRQIVLLLDGKPITKPVAVHARVSEQVVVVTGFDAREVAQRNADFQAIMAAAREAPAEYQPRLCYRIVAGANEEQAGEEIEIDGQTVRLSPETMLDERDVASLDLAVAPRFPLPITLAIAQREDVVAVFLGEKMMNEILGALDGAAGAPTLADSARFQSAVGQLPPAEDALVFFDLHRFLQPFRPLANALTGLAAEDVDLIKNTGGNDEAMRLNAQAVNAYQQGNVKEALRLVVQAYEIDQKDSVILYNLACFNALEGRKEAAFNWLEQAVEGGFFAPAKIKSDPDLTSLHADARFQEILFQAMELAGQDSAADVILNSSIEGPLAELHKQGMEAYEQQNYQRCLELAQEAYKLAPADSRVLYNLACFHARLGQLEKALERLEQAVNGGFYCPQHIAEDPDLESLRQRERFQDALQAARRLAARQAALEKMQPVLLARAVAGRLLDAAETFDYIASVELTDGFTTRSVSLTALVPNADKRPVYLLFPTPLPAEQFDRFLPVETKSFTVGRGVDLKALYRFVEDTFLQTGEWGKALWAKGQQFLAELGLDLQRDLLDWLDSEIVTISLESGDFVLLVKVHDEQLAREKIATALEFLSGTFTAFASQNPMLAMLAFTREPTVHENLPGFEELRFLTAPQPLVWGTAEGYLVFGGSAESAALCLETARGNHPNIRHNERFKTEGLLPAGPFISLAFTDESSFGEDVANVLSAIAMSSGMISLAIPEPEVRNVVARATTMLGKLVPVARRIDFYKSTTSLTTFDGQRWRTEYLTHYFSPDERQARNAAAKP